MSEAAGFARFTTILGSGDRIGERLAAAAARARAETPVRTAHERAIRDVAAGVAGPLLVGYVLWLLLDARERGIRRLYFLSRDGDVLRQIADILAPRLGIDIERRYLYASRLAWNRALGVRRLNHWAWSDSAAALSVADLLRRIDVPRAAVEADLAAEGFADLDAPLESADLFRLRDLLYSDRLAAALAAAQAESRALLLDYLEQEDVFDTVPKAVVDLGWSGSQHETLCDLLVERGAEPCLCYLFGARAFASPWARQRRGFYFDEGDAVSESFRSYEPSDAHALVPRDLYLLMETFCSAPHGTLAGFRRSGDRVEPDLAPDRGAELIAWGLPLLRRTLAATAASLDVEGLAHTDIAPRQTPAFRSAMSGLLEAFWLAPTPDQASAWGSFPWDAGQGHEEGSVPLAEPYTLADLASTWRQGSLRKRTLFWVRGALRMTPPHLATALRGTNFLRRQARSVLTRFLRSRAAPSYATTAARQR
jgi:hypothetical protein